MDQACVPFHVSPEPVIHLLFAAVTVNDDLDRAYEELEMLLKDDISDATNAQSDTKCGLLQLL